MRPFLALNRYDLELGFEAFALNGILFLIKFLGELGLFLLKLGQEFIDPFTVSLLLTLTFVQVILQIFQ